MLAVIRLRCDVSMPQSSPRPSPRLSVESACAWHGVLMRSRGRHRNTVRACSRPWSRTSTSCRIASGRGVSANAANRHSDGPAVARHTRNGQLTLWMRPMAAPKNHQRFTNSLSSDFPQRLRQVRDCEFVVAADHGFPLGPCGSARVRRTRSPIQRLLPDLRVDRRLGARNPKPDLGRDYS
jgi:hypothetical protein